MRVLIADDENFVRMNFKSFMDWERHGYQLIGEARNGQEAIDKLAELKPDIVFLDIRMPVMDGLEVLRQLNTRSDPCKVIILSSYNEFEYVREAMLLGAVDYIHKPSLYPALVFETLNRVRSLVDEERKQTDQFEQLRRNEERSKPDLKALFCKGWIEGSVRHEWEIEQKTKQLAIDLKQPNVCCMLLFIDNYEAVQKRYAKPLDHLVGFSVNNILREIFRKFEQLEFFQVSGNQFAILKSYAKLRSLNDVFEQQWHLIRTIRTALKQFMNIGVSFSVSALHSQLLKVPAAYEEALRASEDLFFEGESSVVFYENVPRRKSANNERGYEDLAKQIRTQAEASKWDEADASLHTLFDTIEKKRDIGKKETLDLSVSLHYSLLETCSEANRDTNGSGFPTIEDIMGAENLALVRQLLATELAYLRGKRQETGISTNLKIQKVLAYIHNYFDHDLTLEELAHHVGLNSSYLSRLFKEQTSMMLIPYINQYRVKKSLDDLLAGKLKTYEIAEKVGFNSADNYYIAFKKVYGQPPNEYRKSILEGTGK
ncbi:response regulator [Cohnella ginsengisoli]|uniref:Response regulator n=1 Tax=Cohnella ginsengisoli TaxID=425004 RepID=A0A9X4KDA6_9BACL|nr:response regulator [Cohnella ginsengisoli]MDG0790034.1 response regulator [Cohnella ginsengisoli]